MDQFKLKRILLFVVLFAGVFYLALELPYYSQSVPQFIVNTAMSIPGMVIGALLFAGLIIWMREDIWLMIPLGLINPIPLGFLPFGFRWLELSFVILLTYFFVVHAAMHHQGFRLGPKRMWVPFAVILLIILYHQAQMGLGLRMAGSGTAGARRHIMMVIGAAFFIAMMSVSPKRWETFRRLPGFYLAWTLVANVPTIFCIYFPEIAGPLGLFSFFANAGDLGNYFGTDLSRISGWGSIGIALQMWLVSRLPMDRWFTPPSVFALLTCGTVAGMTWLLSSALGSAVVDGRLLGGLIMVCGAGVLAVLMWVLRRHLVLFLTAFALWATVFSGFRSQLFYWLAIMGVASLIFLQWRALALYALLGLVMVFLALGNQSLFQLPVSIERSLSFMTFGNWSAEAELSASSSDHFRDYIQEVYLASYAKESPWLGNGYKLAIGDATSTLDLEVDNWTIGYEGFVRRKDFHVGWISLYDCVGIVGSLAFLALIFATAHMIWKRGRQIGWRRLEPVQIWVITLLAYQVSGFFAVFGAMSNIMGFLGFGCALAWLVFKEMPAVEPAVAVIPEPERSLSWRELRGVRVHPALRPG